MDDLQAFCHGNEWEICLRNVVPSLDPLFFSFLADVRAKRYSSALTKLGCILDARDPGTLFTIRNHYGKKLRTAAFQIMRSSADMDVSEKLSLLQFLWNCFALTQDLEEGA
eukprot:c27045_g1_i2 orf=69-401(-)